MVVTLKMENNLNFTAPSISVFAKVVHQIRCLALACCLEPPDCAARVPHAKPLAQPAWHVCPQCFCWVAVGSKGRHVLLPVLVLCPQSVMGEWVSCDFHLSRYYVQDVSCLRCHEALRSLCVCKPLCPLHHHELWTVSCIFCNDHYWATFPAYSHFILATLLKHPSRHCSKPAAVCHNSISSYWLFRLQATLRFGFSLQRCSSCLASSRSAI